MNDPPRTKTLIIDMPGERYFLYLNGELHQTAPISRPRTARKVGDFYKHLGYTIIVNKGAKKKMATTNQSLYDAMTTIIDKGSADTLNKHTVRALQNRDLLDRGCHITDKGFDFMETYEKENGIAPAQPDAPGLATVSDQSAVAAETEAVIETLNGHYAHQETPETALREIREIALDAVEDICRKSAPEAIAHIRTIRRADKFLSGG